MVEITGMNLNRRKKNNAKQSFANYQLEGIKRPLPGAVSDYPARNRRFSL